MIRRLRTSYAVLGLIHLFLQAPSAAQSRNDSTLVRDSLWSVTLPGTVVTATRTPASLEDVPIPTRVLSAEAIEQQGALRLSDFLAERTGIVVTSNFGAGIQIQGFDPAYTLVLIDGEPLIGRTAGTLDLDRIPVSDIGRVEIVEGPSSSLYGSEALAGVINIVTKQPEEPLSVTLDGRVQSHETTSLNAGAEMSGSLAGLRLQYTLLQTAGYDLSPDVAGLTAPGYDDHTFSTRASLDARSNVRFDLSGRYSLQRQNNTIGFDEGGTEFSFEEKARREEWALSPRVTWRPGKVLRLSARFHATDFINNSDLQNPSGPSSIRFHHRFRKAEVEADLLGSSNHLLSLGGGGIFQTVTADRIAGRHRRNNTLYAFLEHRWFAASGIELYLSARFDVHSDYASRLSPKVGLFIRANPNLRFRASVGAGFKAPTFQQLYMDFTNAVAGYSVVGAEDVRTALDRFEEAGEIDYYLSDPSSFGAIRPENSRAFNVSAQYRFSRSFSVELRAFRNDVRDLIETLPVATKPNGQNIFTYTNLNRIFTQGIGLDLRLGIVQGLTVSAGYQFLDARDKDVLDDIDAGRLFTRLDGRDRRLTRSDYGGLFNRSRHTANVQFAYRNAGRGWSVSLRGVYRSRYGFGDLNGNLILDSDREYVDGYAVWHASAVVPVRQSVVLQAGIRNLLDVTNPSRIPSLPGRIFYAGASLRLHPKP